MKDMLLQRILQEQGIPDPEGLIDALSAAGYELRHSELLQTARSLGFPSLEAFWVKHDQATFSELEGLTGFDRKTLHTSKKRYPGPGLNSSIAAQPETWGEPPEKD